jgi:pimeloyl-ACP methyl ester carboxylesterase
VYAPDGDDRLTEPGEVMGLVPSTDDVSVAVRSFGGSGPPLLLVHATSLHGLVWRPFAAAVEDRTVVAIDVRGHGAAEGPTGLAMDWDGVTDDVLAVVDALDLAGCDAIGHSMGGAGLLRAEARRPGTFAALWCFEPIVFPPLPPGAGLSNPMADAALRRRNHFPDRAAAEANFAGKPPFAALDPDALRAYVQAGFIDVDDGIELACRPEVEAETYRMGAHHDTWDRLASIECPVAVARGGDGGHPAQAAPRITEQLPHGVLEEHPDVAHFGPLERPAELAGAAMTFFGVAAGA